MPSEPAMLPSGPAQYHTGQVTDLAAVKPASGLSMGQSTAVLTSRGH